MNKIRLDDSWAFASIIEVGLRDIPSTDHKVNWVYQWNQVLDRLVDITESLSCLIILEADMASSALSERTVEVSTDCSVLGLPWKLLLVSKDTSNKGRSVVATETNEHNSQLGNLLLCSDGVLFDDILACLFLLVEDSESLWEFWLEKFSLICANAASSLYNSDLISRIVWLAFIVL